MGNVTTLTGFNPSDVSTSIKNIKISYEHLYSQVHDNMQSQFVKGMSDKWACKQAMEFFDSFKQTISKLIEGVNTTYESVVKSMNSAANSWAEKTKTSFSPVSFEKKANSIDVSSIKENINGVRGVNIPEAKSVVAKLNTIKADSQKALNEAKTAVQTCGFVGGNQAANLQTSLQTISNNINSAIDEISRTTIEAINKTANTYTTTAEQISNAFKG